jgi:hypothetical protein
MKALLPFLALSVALLPISSAEESYTTKPTIVYVLFDVIGYGEPTCYRPDSKLKTPNLDRLAAAGDALRILPRRTIARCIGWRLRKQNESQE